MSNIKQTGIIEMSLALQLKMLELCFKKDIPYNIGLCEGHLKALLLVGFIDEDKVNSQMQLIQDTARTNSLRNTR